MTYEKQTWTTGEVITADKLNQTGSGGSFEIIEMIYNDDDDDGSYFFPSGVTESIVKERMNNGTNVVLSFGGKFFYITEFREEGGVIYCYAGSIYTVSTTLTYSAYASNGRGQFVFISKEDQ